MSFEKWRKGWKSFWRGWALAQQRGSNRGNSGYSRQEAVCDCETPKLVVQFEGRGCLFWALVILLFPIGLLLLLIPERRSVMCTNCGRQALIPGVRR